MLVASTVPRGTADPVVQVELFGNNVSNAKVSGTPDGERGGLVGRGPAVPEGPGRCGVRGAEIGLVSLVRRQSLRCPGSFAIAVLGGSGMRESEKCGKPNRTGCEKRPGRGG